MWSVMISSVRKSGESPNGPEAGPVPMPDLKGQGTGAAEWMLRRSVDDPNGTWAVSLRTALFMARAGTPLEGARKPGQAGHTTPLRVLEAISRAALAL